MYDRDMAHKLGLIFLLVPVIILIGLMTIAYGWGIWSPINYVRGNRILQLGILVILIVGYVFLRRSDTWPPSRKKRGIDRLL
jgi:hypothetical protein